MSPSPSTATRPGPAALLSLAGILVVVGLAVLVAAGMTDGFDQAIIDAVRAEALRDLLSPFAVITQLGSTAAVTIMALVAFAFAALIGPWRHGAIAAITILAASLLNGSIKLAIARERPDLLEPVIVERGFSFPSGHSALGMVAYGILAVLVSRSRLPPAVRRVLVFGLGAIVALIGLSRIWLGVHYPTDVLAGWAAGGVIVLIYAAVTRQVSPEPAAAAVDADPAAPRSGPPAAG
jgi:undecaprenyl-diphosphatase